MFEDKGKVKETLSFLRGIFESLSRITTDELRHQRNRNAMLERVEKAWIQGVLNRSLYGVAKIDLEIRQSPDLVDSGLNALFSMQDSLLLDVPDHEDVSDHEDVRSIFEKNVGELLILGAPGSGKTIMLLELAKSLIDFAREDPMVAMPIVLNLSSWSNREDTLETWVIERLKTEYYIPSDISRKWLANDDLILLLDGLDEVKPDLRRSCVEAINTFRYSYGLVNIAVCCRLEVYELLGVKLHLNNAVLLQPLTENQISEYVEHAGDKLSGVHEAMQCDNILRELAKTPLMLHIMSIAYSGKTVHELGVAQSIDERRKHLFDTYSQGMFQRLGRTKQELYPVDRVNHWLSWIANTMEQHNISVFRIEQLQPIYLNDTSKIAKHKIVHIIALIVVTAIIVGITAFISVTLYFKEIVFSTTSIFYIVLNVFCSTFFASRAIKQSDGIVFATKYMWTWNNLKNSLGFAIGTGLIMAIIGGVWLDWESGLLSGIMVMITTTLLNQLKGGHSRYTSYKIFMRYVIFNSIYFSVMIVTISVLLGIALSYVPGLNIWTWDGLVFGAIFGLATGMSLGIDNLLKHLLLRAFLAIDGFLPWRCENFLEFAVERIFLFNVGGGYIFISRLLLEYYADKCKSMRIAFPLRISRYKNEIRDIRLKGLIFLMAYILIIGISMYFKNPESALYALPALVAFLLSLITKSSIVYSFFLSTSIWFVVYGLVLKDVYLLLFPFWLIFAEHILKQNFPLNENFRLAAFNERLINSRIILIAMAVIMTLFVFWGSWYTINLIPKDPSYLGVSYFTVDTGIVISSVESGSPAYKAGLQEGDIVVSLDHRSLADPEILVLLHYLSEYVPGDTITLVLFRDNEMIHRDLILDRWPLNKFPYVYRQMLRLQSFEFLGSPPIPILPCLISLAVIAFSLHLMNFFSPGRKTLSLIGLVTNGSIVITWLLLSAIVS